MGQKVLTYTHQLPGCKIVFLGNQPRIGLGDTDEQHEAIEIARAELVEHGADRDRICHVIPPSTDEDRGFQTIARANVMQPVRAEGVILTPGMGGFLQTADCPTLIGVNTTTRKITFAHAGKYAMRPSSNCASGACSSNIATTFARTLCDGHPESVYVHIVGSICPTCFRHNDERGQSFIQPYIKTFGEHAFVGSTSDGCLALTGIATNQIAGYEVPRSQITVADFCTFEELGCTSHRELGNNRVISNTVGIITTNT